MRESGSDPPVTVRRMKRASALVAAAILAMVLACVAADNGLASDGSPSGSLVKRVWGSVSAGGKLEDALREAGIVKVTKENVPAWLERELLSLDQMNEPITNSTFELLWFLRKGAKEDVAESIRNELAAKGWSTCGSDANGMETFVKGKGDCTWAMAECAQAGDDVAIVLHIRHT